MSQSMRAEGGVADWCGQGSLFDQPAPIHIVRRPAGAGVGRSVALTPDVERLLARNAVASCSISGGKDGTAMALAVNRHLDAIGHTGPRVLIHSDLGRVEWKDSLPACQRLAAHMGWELVVERRKAGDMMARWEGRWANNVARYESLACVKIILPWSTPSMRFCTAEYKAHLLSRALKKRYPQHDILNIVGIRRQESANRSRMPVSAPNPALVRRGHVGLTWNAVIEWTLEDVWDEINASGVVAHEAYTKYGSSRVSCTYCIMSSGHDLLAAAGCSDNHDIYRQMVRLEATSTFAFQGARWLADVSPSLLGDELTQLVARAKVMAVQRQQAEAEIPKHLLYTKGWPTVMPTLDEAELMARVRRQVGEVLNLEPRFITGREVRDRYAELLAGKEGGLLDEAEDGEAMAAEVELVPA